MVICMCTIFEDFEDFEDFASSKFTFLIVTINFHKLFYFGYFICLKSLFVSEKCCTFAVDYGVGRKE